MNKHDILIVDDDKDLAAITKDMLEDHGYPVTIASSVIDAYDILSKQQFKLILLDINLPDGTGFDICTELRKYTTVPIIFISARTNESDRINGLDIGADDYLPKPYSLQELLSRINANIRRAYGFHGKEQLYQCGDLLINLTSRKVFRANIEVMLSLKEFDLLSYLVQHKNTALKKETLLSEVWGAFSEVELSTVAVHIRWLREKLEIDPSNPELIQTVWGIGYLFTGGDNEYEA